MSRTSKSMFSAPAMVAVSPEMKEKGRYTRIPENLYAPVVQGVVVLRASHNPQGAPALLDYTKSPATAALLERHGFVLPGKEKN